MKNNGALYKGEDWDIILKEKIPGNKDVKLIKVIKYKNPEILMCEETIFSHYAITAEGCYNKIPEKYYDYIEKNFNNINEIIK